MWRTRDALRCGGGAGCALHAGTVGPGSRRAHRSRSAGVLWNRARAEVSHSAVLMQPALATFDWFAALAWVLLALGVGVVAAGLFGDRSRGRARCPRCWYSMAGTPGLTC